MFVEYGCFLLQLNFSIFQIEFAKFISAIGQKRLPDTDKQTGKHI